MTLLPEPKLIARNPHHQSRMRPAAMEIIVSSLSDLTHPLRFVAFCVGRVVSDVRPMRHPLAEVAQPVKGGGFNLGFGDGGHGMALGTFSTRQARRRQE